MKGSEKGHRSCGEHKQTKNRLCSFDWSSCYILSTELCKNKLLLFFSLSISNHPKWSILQHILNEKRGKEILESVCSYLVMKLLRYFLFCFGHAFQINNPYYYFLIIFSSWILFNQFMFLFIQYSFIKHFGLQCHPDNFHETLLEEVSQKQAQRSRNQWKNSSTLQNKRQKQIK